MKPLDVIQLVLGIIVGTCVLRPDLAGLPPSQETSSWPREVEVASDENKVAAETNLHCRARRGTIRTSLPKAVASMPPRAGAFAGGKMPFSGRRKLSRLPSANLDMNQNQAKKAREEEISTVMIATHHGCEVF
mmetsp:Transcript_27221/g.78493  ORF Transcript_27221/g.78493 Transcript_27221/m.78493 type:complete len:133 (-) Transcript_27221:1500-1898(-)